MSAQQNEDNTETCITALSVWRFFSEYLIKHGNRKSVELPATEVKNQAGFSTNYYFPMCFPLVVMSYERLWFNIATTLTCHVPGPHLRRRKHWFSCLSSCLSRAESVAWQRPNIGLVTSTTRSTTCHFCWGHEGNWLDSVSYMSGNTFGKTHLIFLVSFVIHRISTNTKA